MRYVIAIAFACLGAVVMALYISTPLANEVVRARSFDNPDDVANLHALVFMALNGAGLIAGWIVGWLVGGLVARG
jgi:hypothetical protein